MRFTDRQYLRRHGALAALLVLGGCATDALDLAPSDPTVPWPITPPAELQNPKPLNTSIGRLGVEMPSVSREGAVLIDPGRSYNLAELIDIAQRSNPQTREAWEHARQAALAVGLIESTYLPQLSAEAIAGYQHSTFPIPANLVPNGQFTAVTEEALPALAVKWLLFDFGRRAGAEKAAKAESFVANVAFTGAHQKLIFAVSRDYFGLSAARGRLNAAKEAVVNAQVVEDAVMDRRNNGLATTVEVAQAQRQSAEARFNLARATGDEHSAYQALIASMGVATSVTLKVADSSAETLPPAPPDAVTEFVDIAMARRPDMVAARGEVLAAEAKLDQARADYGPTVALVGQGYENIGQISVQGSRYYSSAATSGNLLLQFSLPLFDGGARDARVDVARSAVAAAKDVLDQTRNVAVKQVTDAFYALNTTLAEHAAATALVFAARTAYDAALDAYRHGVGTYTDLVADETALTRSESELDDAHSGAFTAAAALAFATGSITSAQQGAEPTGEPIRAGDRLNMAGTKAHD
jgi:outer membrane protein TolC